MLIAAIINMSHVTVITIYDPPPAPITVLDAIIIMTSAAIIIKPLSANMLRENTCTFRPKANKFYFDIQ